MTHAIATTEDPAVRAGISQAWHAIQGLLSWIVNVMFWPFKFRGVRGRIHTTGIASFPSRM
jgi:hypothetical protein